MILVLLLLTIVCSEASIWLTVHLSIENDIKADITLHCKSKDDDLGEHTLNNSSDFRFKFQPNIFKTTLFFCSFAWPNAFHWFNIYNYMRDSGSCVHHCDWKIKPDHPCLYDIVCYRKTYYDWPTKFSTQYSICTIWHNLAHNIAYAKFGTSFDSALEDGFCTLC